MATSTPSDGGTLSSDECEDKPKPEQQPKIQTEQPDTSASSKDKEESNSDTNAIVTLYGLHRTDASISPRQQPLAPSFYDALHARYITTLSSQLDAPTSFEGAMTQHLRMSGVYWSVTALSLLRSPAPVEASMSVTTSMVNWVWQCFDEQSGGFGGNVGHDGHLLYTLSALQILAIAHQINDDQNDIRWMNKKAKINQFVTNLQQTDGSFAGDAWGEIDTRFTYCALSCWALLDSLPGTFCRTKDETLQQAHRVQKAADYILKCRNLDGGFGSVIGAESHAGQVFCCIAALSIARSLDKLSCEDVDLLSWWLAERQVDSGGLNGRPEKQADVCYSWWILSAMSILGTTDWIKRDKLATFILQCQDPDDGGIADRPDDMPDVFHTFFGIAGLSLLGHLHPTNEEEQSPPNLSTTNMYRSIDPVYALPSDLVQQLKLPGQVVCRKPSEGVDRRLRQYDVVTFGKNKKISS